MKKQFLTITLALGLTLAFAGGGNHEYKINSKKSTLTWTGKAIKKQHTGTTTISSGHVDIDGGKITKGSFTIDMKSVHNTDMEGTYQKKLEKHLMGSDFFDVAKFPTSTLTIKKAEHKNGENGNTHIITANLTIKGSTHEITFPAKLTVVDHNFTGDAYFKINRTTWNIKYGSGSFFDNLGDKAIDDNIKFRVHIEAIASHH